MLAAIDGDALYQLVVLVLLGGGSLLKSWREKAAKDSAGAKRQRLGDSMADRVQNGRGDVISRLAAFEERQGRMGEAPSDPWQGMEEELELESTAQAALEEELYLEELMVEVPVPSGAEATPEASIESGSLEGSSFDDVGFDDSDWVPGGRIREAVREDIEKKVSMDIAAHVEADMSGGVRGDAQLTTSAPIKRSKARHPWRDAVIAAELLGAPLALRAAESQVPGLRNG